MKKLILWAALVASVVADSVLEERTMNFDVPTSSENQISMGLNVGTLGVGVNLSLPLNESVSLRANINKFKYHLNKKYKKVSFSGDLDLSNGGVLLDYFPANNFFRLSAGAYINKNKVSGVSNFTKTLTVKVYHIKREFTDHVKIESEAKFNNISPYVGIGWGNNISKKGWNTTLDVGMIYQGLAKITFDTTTKYDLTKERLKKDIQREKDRVEDFAKKYRLYPVISVGISYSF